MSTQLEQLEALNMKNGLSRIYRLTQIELLPDLGNGKVRFKFDGINDHRLDFIFIFFDIGHEPNWQLGHEVGMLLS